MRRKYTLNFISYDISNYLDCKKREIRIFFWFSGILIGALQAVRYRYELSSNDIIAYLDIADAYLKGDWDNAINGNWSPLYSWILAFFDLLLKPSDSWQFPFVKLVNFIIFIFTFASFEFFLRHFYGYFRKQILKEPKASFSSPEWVWLCLGYSLFLLSSLQWIRVYCDTPDMLNAGFIYLSTGIVLRIYRYPEEWLNFLALGGALALGYFSRAAMFPLGFCFLIASLFTTGKLRKALPRMLAALMVFLLISSPYVVTLSLKKGDLTFSETGKLSYVWYVYPTMRVIPDTLWYGEHPEFGTPKNPIRKIFENPDVFEFGEPISGTYPLWTDPSYWYEGIITRFHLRASLKMLILNIQFYWGMFLGALVFSYLTFILWSNRSKSALRNLITSWPLLFLSISGLTVYALSTNFLVNNYAKQPSSRFIAAFIVVLFLEIYSTIRLPNLKSTKSIITSLTLATVVFVFLQLSPGLAKDASAITFKKQENVHWQVAEEMKRLGLKSGEKIAFFGNEDHRSYHIYWARLAGVKIVAQLEKPEEFWKTEKIVQTRVLESLETAGVRVAIQAGMPFPINSVNDVGWQKLDNTGNTQYYAYFLLPH
jgi:hypothetical protein